MDTAELTNAEFAYLLATLDCEDVVGLDDSTLFPTNASVKGKTFKRGRQELEAHGWITPLPDQPDEYEMNAQLLEVVSVIAAPFFMIASTHVSDQSQAELVYHYLNQDHSVELTAMDENHYRLGLLEERSQIFNRIIDMMGVSGRNDYQTAVIDEEILGKTIQSINKGKTEAASELLSSADLKKAELNSLLASLTSTSRSALVVVGLEAGKITGGRRVSIYGTGEGAWMAHKTSPRTSDIELHTCSKSSLSNLINHFLEELSS